MKFPEDLPEILYWRMGECVKPTLCRRPVSYQASSGRTDAPEVCPQIPYGADGWRLSDDEPWRPLSELPQAWLPFLNRPRGSEMDPRPKVQT